MANIALNGIENLGSCIRYADDMVFTIRKGDDIEKLKADIDDFLAIRGLNVKASKTRLVNMKDGEDVDFLGLTFYLRPDGVSTSRPGKEWLKKTKEDIRHLIKTSGMPRKDLRKKIWRIVDGKRRFYQYSNLNKVKGEWWELDQYVYKELGVGIPGLRFSLTRKHVNVKGDKSPFDGDWIYWSKRNSKRYGDYTTQAKILRRQGGKCGKCGLYLTEPMEIHLHHKDGNHSNSKLDNLQMVHRACHMIHHRTRARVNAATCESGAG